MPRSSRSRSSYEDYITTSIRLLKEGLSLSHVQRVFGDEFAERVVRGVHKCARLVQGGFLHVEQSDDEKFMTVKVTTNRKGGARGKLD